MPSKKILVLTSEIIIDVHEYILEPGQLPGLDQLKVDGIIARVQQRIIYDDLDDPVEIAAWYGVAIAKGHAFTDGNKRTATTCMDIYLESAEAYIDTKYYLDFSYYENEVADIMIDVAKSRVNQPELADFLRDHLQNNKD